MFLVNHFENGHLENTNLAMISYIALAALIVLPVPYVIYKVIEFFKKTKDAKRTYSKKLISLTFVSSAISAIGAVISILAYYGENIFQEADLSMTIWIVSIVIAFSFGIVFYFSLIIFNGYLAVSVDENQITLIGENFLNEKITNIIFDKEKNSIYLIIQNPNKSFKKIRFILKSKSGVFIKENLEIFKLKTEEFSIAEFIKMKNRETQIERQQEFEDFKIKMAESKKDEIEISNEAKNEKEEKNKKEDDSSNNK